MKQLSKRIRQIFFSLLFFSTLSNAQELYFSSGLNFTNYDFRGTDNLPLNFNSKASNFYEIGYNFKLKENDLFNYSVGLAINSFDASAGDTANFYDWNTTYMGFNNQFQYTLIPAMRIPFELSGGVQLQLMHIIDGEQKINGATYNLTNEAEFRGLFIQPGAIITAKYYLSDDWQLSLAYNYSNSFNLSNKTDEKLGIINQQLRFGIHLNIK